MRELDARAEWALTKARDVRFAAEDTDELLEDDDEAPEQQVQFMRAYVLAHQRTLEWQRVLDRIDRGELTWRYIVESLRARNLEPDLKYAFDSLRKVPRVPAEQMTEIAQAVRADLRHTDPPPEATAEESATPTETHQGRFAGLSDDEDWDDPSRMWRG